MTTFSSFSYETVRLMTLGAWGKADVIEMTTGERVEGRDARIGGDFVTLVVGEQTIFFRRSEVRTLYLGPAPAPCPKPS